MHFVFEVFVIKRHNADCNVSLLSLQMNMSRFKYTVCTVSVTRKILLKL